MQSRYRLRLYLLTAAILIGCGTLLTRLHEFQIERQDEFLQGVPGIRTETVREPGIRGEIFDRNGVLLARNLKDYAVSFNLDEVYQAYRMQHASAPITETTVIRDGMRRPQTRTDIVAVVNESVIEPLKKLGLAANYSAAGLRTHYVTHGGLVPFTYRNDLTYEEFARFAENNLDLPGVYLSTVPRREYPYGALASHVLGHLKRWERGDIPETEVRKFDHYIGEDKGILGIEATQDALLRCPEGERTILKDEKGKVVNLLDYVKPGVGAKLELSIDARVQFLLENTLRRAGRAAGVIMDVTTGEVIAMASVPDFDPNVFFPSISQERLDSYSSNQKLAPLTNRCLEAFAPGSTFKLPTAIAGALGGVADGSFGCEGQVVYGTQPVRCWLFKQSGGRHGSLTLPRAIQVSCNPFFNKMANKVGWQTMVEGFQLVGFGHQTGIELPNESAGILPGSRTWRATYPNATMTQHSTAMVSIGQGQAMATPLQLCAMVSCIANGGKYYQPRLVKRAISQDGEILVPDQPRLVVDLLKSGIAAADLELIREGMYRAVNEPGGTASRVRLPEIKVAAKTGTAQTTDFGKESHNSLMVAFAPFESPRYAVAIVVQNGGSGGKVCGPLTNLVLRGLFAADNGLVLPLQKQEEYAGHLDRIEEISLPTDVLAAIDASAATEDAGETGDEFGDLEIEAPRMPETVLPSPTVTPEIDAEGLVIPRATPVEEP